MRDAKGWAEGWRAWLGLALLVALYLGAAKLGLRLALVHPSATPVWPASGIALAACLYVGSRVWPGILVGAFLANLTTVDSLLTALGVAGGNTAEALAGAWLVRRFANGLCAFERPRHVLKFAVLAGLLSTTLSASLGVSSLALAGFAEWRDTGSIWLTWWLGDASGDLVVAPLLLLWAAKRPAWDRRRTLEASLLLGTLVLLGLALFGDLLPPDLQHRPVEFLSLPPLLWAAFRFGPRETASATALLSGLAVWGTLRGAGPFASPSPNTSLLLLQTFMAGIGLTALAVAAAVHQQRQALELSSRAAAIVDSSQDAIIGKSLDGTILSWNAGAERLYGYRAEEVVGRGVSLLLPDHRADELSEILLRVQRGERVPAFETTRARKDGRELVVSLQVSPVRNAAGLVVAASAVARDVTERKRAEEALRCSEQRYRRLFERNLAGVYRAARDGRLLECNQALASMLGCATRGELLERTPEQLFFDLRERDACLERLALKGVLTNVEVRMRGKDGAALWVLENLTLLRDDGEDAVEGTLIDITERKLAEEQTEYRAYHDALTGLPNRRLLQDRLHFALGKARRKQRLLGLIFLDLDRFKDVNDVLGHAWGDELLRKVAARLRAGVREDDTVARLGGDEFVLLLPRIRHSEGAARIARKLLKRLAQPFVLGVHELRITGSAGIALYPQDGVDAQSLLERADAAMYRAKQQGCNGYCFCDPTAAVHQGPRP